MEAARAKIQALIQSGAGLAKFQEIVRAQGGDPEALVHYDRLPKARHVSPVVASASGYVSRLDAEKVGLAVMRLGAGRDRVDANIDPAVGVVLQKKVGDAVQPGEPLGFVHYNDATRFRAVESLLASAFEVSQAPVRKPALIKKVIT